VGKLAEDDDRPPIIVKGGSLYFENTTTKRPGKVWKEVTAGNKKVWGLDHDNGKKVSFYQVYFVGGSGVCAPVETEEVSVNFDHDSNPNTPDRQYTVNVVDKRPRVSSTYDLEVDSDATRLIAGREGRFSNVVIGGTVCTSPTAAYLEPIK
jgi:hypothetical protein